MRVVVAVGVIALLGVTEPALADGWGRPSAPAALRTVPKVWRDGADLRERIDDGRRAGQLSRSEARQFKREARQTDQLRARYGGDGLSDAEAAELATRAALLRDDVGRERLKARR